VANLGYIQVTRQCNQVCRFCSNPPVEEERTLAEAQALVDDLRHQGYDGVILTGGEPTLVPYLPELISYCRSQGIPARLITNGTRLRDAALLDELIAAGLKHGHFSLHSSRPDVHDLLTGRHGNHRALLEALELIGRRPGTVNVDINCVLVRPNADHLDELVSFVVNHFPFVHHFVFNGLDPDTERLAQNGELIPRLWEFELALARAAHQLTKTGRSLRVERVPLCYMAGFEHCSTETRKIAKHEERTTHFLDQRRAVRQEPGSFVHHHTRRCQVCSLQAICAGIYPRPEAYHPEELAPQFVDAEPIRQRICAAGQPDSVS
jgi:MoaA/NifB/PqqE/SkfB family radical SAM enzyme